MRRLKNYINGQMVSPVEGKYLNNYCPATGEVYSLVPRSSVKDVDLAIASAKKSFKLWGKSKKEYRYEWMMRLADAIDRNANELVKAESKDNGKPE